MPRARKNSLNPSGTSDRPRNPASDWFGMAAMVASAVRAYLVVAVFGEHREKADLLERARRETAGRRQKANVPGDFSAFEEIQQWASNAEIHQGVRNS